jgi:hypothetical protein
VLQILKAGLAFELKDGIGVEAIELRERELLRRVFANWLANPAIEILGNPDPDRRISIISFNLRDPGGKYLHPKFVTTLLNDLFGIQSRAGCSCAGPYGHRLLGIDHDASEQYRKWIRKGFSGVKPGWCRISLHYVMDDIEVQFIIDAVNFVARHGHRFLPDYNFDLHTGAWLHKCDCVCLEGFSLEAALRCSHPAPTALGMEERAVRYTEFRREAEKLAQQFLFEPDYLLGRAIGAPRAGTGEIEVFSATRSLCEPAVKSGQAHRFKRSRQTPPSPSSLRSWLPHRRRA